MVDAGVWSNTNLRDIVTGVAVVVLTVAVLILEEP